MYWLNTVITAVAWVAGFTIVGWFQHNATTKLFFNHQHNYYGRNMPDLAALHHIHTHTHTRVPTTPTHPTTILSICGTRHMAQPTEFVPRLCLLRQTVSATCSMTPDTPRGLGI